MFGAFKYYFFATAQPFRKLLLLPNGFIYICYLTKATHDDSSNGPFEVLTEDLHPPQFLSAQAG
jgi:hypothetical protein